MTMNHRLFEDLEIAFWNTTIPAMTGIRKVQQTIQRASLVIQRVIPRRVLLQSIVWSVIGLVMGVLIGLTVASL